MGDIVQFPLKNTNSILKWALEMKLMFRKVGQPLTVQWARATIPAQLMAAVVEVANQMEDRPHAVS